MVPGEPCTHGEEMPLSSDEEDKEEDWEEKKQEREGFVEKLGVDFPCDYERQLNKHGWKMEIPGDPLNLK